MHPAFSVIFFTTARARASACWRGSACSRWLARCRRAFDAGALALGMALAAAGLLSLLAHLGQPQRAWMAFSQWRSSWLSREGVFATLCFGPALWLAWSPGTGAATGARRGSGLPRPGVDLDGRLAGRARRAALATVVCTAMIYASLKPIPAWRHRLVPPVYGLFALFSAGCSGARSRAGGPAGHRHGRGLAPASSPPWAASRRVLARRRRTRARLPRRRGRPPARARGPCSSARTPKPTTCQGNGLRGGAPACAVLRASRSCCSPCCRACCVAGVAVRPLDAGPWYAAAA